MSVDQRKRRIVADGADIAEVIGDAFEFGHDAAQDGGARRRFNAERCLNCEREREAERDCRIARYSRYDARCLGEGCAGQQGIDALVHITKAFLEPRYGFAIGREAEMTRLDNAGMHRADRDLVEAVSVHSLEFIIGRVATRARDPRTERSVEAPLAMIEPRAAVERIQRHMTVKVAYCPLEPDCRRMEPADGREASASFPAPVCRLPTLPRMRVKGWEGGCRGG